MVYLSVRCAGRRDILGPKPYCSVRTVRTLLLGKSTSTLWDLMNFPFLLDNLLALYSWAQRRRAIEALEARAPQTVWRLATVVNSIQNRVKSITVCVTLNANTGKIVLVTLCIQIEWLFYIMFSAVKL